MDHSPHLDFGLHTNEINDTFLIGGDLPMRRMGFGAMRLTGPGVWGPPEDEPNACAVLRRAVELGVQFVDTADVYGPGDNERLIREALHPYAPGLVIGTKGGLVRSGPATRANRGTSMNGTEAHIPRRVGAQPARERARSGRLVQLGGGPGES